MVGFTHRQGGQGFFHTLIALIGLAAISVASSALAGELNVLELTMKERQIEAPQATLRVNQGEEVAFRVRSDETAELHLHGYDVTIPLEANQTSDVRFLANVAGRFPITLHEPAASGGHSHRHKTLLYLEVYPD